MILGTIFLFGLANRNMTRNLVSSTERAADNYSQVRARSIANGTVQMILAELSDSTSWRVTSPRTANLFGGSAEFTVIDTTVSGEFFIRIASTGTFAGERRSVTALARHEIPPFFKYAAASDGDFIINATRDTIRDAFNTQWNANIHTNNQMILNLSSTLIKGFVTYTGGITYDPAEVTISPNQNPLGLPVHYSAPKVEIPNFDPAAYASLATQTINGDYTFNGGALGTRQNPAIIYVKGKLEIQGTVTGYGVFIVKDDIDVKGSLLVSPVDPLGSKLGLYTAQKITINDPDMQIHAQMFAMNKFIVNGENTRIFGNIATKSKCTFNAQDIRLYYKPALETLTTPFWFKHKRRLAAQHLYE